ncbi:glycoside hydrolase family 5 protein [Oribacterium sp. FC2011]|uniref:glycoside hydrolase family 5 protein n=1 Tax=Oribacterium sp. FC2011 TaxID=1408311 RepID=UPI000679E494|nr:glycoside hydrolase family 5 protein [Oribacterium sp. FC2011]
MQKRFYFILITLSIIFFTVSISPASTVPGNTYQVIDAQNQTTASASLQVIGPNLCDSTGAKIQLKGISTHGIQWFPEYINTDCFRFFRDNWGCNLIRFAMYTEEGGYLSSNEKAVQLKALIENGVQSCTSLGMYSIIDWHILSDGNPLSHVEEAKSFFNGMSALYKDNPYVIYEICNEPNGGTSWNDIKAYAEQVIPVIRANAPDAIILVGTPTWSQDVDQAAANPISPELSHNVMYTLHFYAATHRDDLRNKLMAARAAGLPVFISEFSTCDASGNGAVDYNSANTWFNLIKENNLSFAGWNLSNKAESSAILKPGTISTTGAWTDGDFSETGILLKSLMADENN